MRDASGASRARVAVGVLVAFGLGIAWAVLMVLGPTDRASATELPTPDLTPVVTTAVDDAEAAVATTAAPAAAAVGGAAEAVVTDAVAAVPALPMPELPSLPVLPSLPEPSGPPAEGVDLIAPVSAAKPAPAADTPGGDMPPLSPAASTRDAPGADDADPASVGTVLADDETDPVTPDERRALVLGAGSIGGGSIAPVALLAALAAGWALVLPRARRASATSERAPGAPTFATDVSPD